jgi:hypothetical protein
MKGLRKLLTRFSRQKTPAIHKSTETYLEKSLDSILPTERSYGATELPTDAGAMPRFSSPSELMVMVPQNNILSNGMT